MSDHRVQGSGLSSAILDTKKPSTGGLHLENISVMLSRVSEWEDLAILWPFDESMYLSYLQH